MVKWKKYPSLSITCYLLLFLKLSAPSSAEDYERTLVELDQLRDALVYWGKIIQRQNKIKFIRGTTKLKLIDDYEKMVNEELAYISNEK